MKNVICLCALTILFSTSISERAMAQQVIWKSASLTIDIDNHRAIVDAHAQGLSARLNEFELRASNGLETWVIAEGAVPNSDLIGQGIFEFDYWLPELGLNDPFTIGSGGASAGVLLEVWHMNMHAGPPYVWTLEGSEYLDNPATLQAGLTNLAIRDQRLFGRIEYENPTDMTCIATIKGKRHINDDWVALDDQEMPPRTTGFARLTSILDGETGIILVDGGWTPHNSLFRVDITCENGETYEGPLQGVGGGIGP